MSTKKMLVLAIGAYFACIEIALSASAADIPSFIVKFNADEPVITETRPDATFIKHLSITNQDTNREITIELTPVSVDYGANDPQRKISMPREWINFVGGSTYTIKPLEKKTIQVQITVPPNTSEGLYRFEGDVKLKDYNGKPSETELKETGVKMSMVLGVNFDTLVTLKAPPVDTSPGTVPLYYYYIVVAVLVLIIVVVLIKILNKRRHKIN